MKLELNGGVPIGEEIRDSWIEEGEKFFRENPDEPFWFCSSGDSLVVFLHMGDEICVFDSAIRREIYIEEQDIQPKQAAKTNDTNDICYFCGQPTEALFGNKRVCRRCKK